jgi:Tetratricopeptide repeat
MKRKMLLVAACAATLWSVSAIGADATAASAARLPTPDDVRAAVNAGDWPKAESLVREVVAARPGNARAHYFYAEILAHEGKFADAAGQAHKARELDPALSFDKNPENFRKFEREVDRAAAGPSATTAPPVGQAPAAAVREVPAPAVPVQAAHSGIPGWVWVGGVALVLFFVFRALSRRAVANNLAGAGGYGMSPGMAQPGYGPAQAGYGPGYGQAPGGGLLRTGLAAAGGVAGGMLLERMLEGNRHDDGNANYGNGGGYVPQGGGDNGYNQAASDLENRPFDAGQGGNDWSDGGGDGGGGDFSSGGSSDDGGGW